MTGASSSPQPTRAAGLERLRRFLPRAGGEYARRRNFDTAPGPRDNVSLLSPYIRHRLVGEEEVLRATVRQHTPAAAEKFIQEVIWRTYFKGWLEQHPDAWHRYRRDVAHLVTALASERGLRERVARAEEGRTGIDCFDAWAAELTASGYLHNHARMWFASIWIYTLGLPWQLGADFFYRHLLDGDPASNTLSWRWVCGLHTRGKTYLARAANIERYTEGRFRPTGLADAAPALTEDAPPARRPLRPAHAPPASGRVGLLISEEDGHSETLPLAAPPVALCALTATAARSPRGVGEAAARFAAGAVGDALERASGHFQVTPHALGEVVDWGPVLSAWARAQRLDAIVCALAPLGPVAEQLGRARGTLAEAGVELVEIIRPYDAAAWPHAGHGFFRMKKALPALLPL